jgi:hypothetical protein
VAARGKSAKALLFGLVAVAATGAATWFVWDLTHDSLGLVGGTLAAFVAALMAGAPFFIVWAAVWGPQHPVTAPEDASTRQGVGVARREDRP